MGVQDLMVVGSTWVCRRKKGERDVVGLGSRGRTRQCNAEVPEMTQKAKEISRKLQLQKEI